jgi:hypothetical protein
LAITFPADFADPNGVGLCDVRAPMTLTFMRNAPRQSEPQLLILNAPWAPMQEDGNDGDPGGALSQLEAQFRGPFALLERRFTPAEVVFADQDAGQIAWSLIDATQTTEGTAGISLGTIAATISRDRTYNDKQIAEA